MEKLLKKYCKINFDIKDDECLLFTAVDMQNFALEYHTEQLLLLGVGFTFKEKEEKDFEKWLCDNFIHEAGLYKCKLSRTNYDLHYLKKFYKEAKNQP